MPETNVENLLKGLQSKDEKARLSAASKLAKVDGTQKSLRNFLNRELRCRRRLRDARLLKIVFGFVLYELLNFVLEFYFDKVGWGKLIRNLVSHLYMVVLGGMWLSWSCDSIRMALKLSALETQASNRQMVGFFAKQLGSSDKAIRKIAADALINLMPQVQGSDKQNISDGEMRALVDALKKSRRDDALRIAILKGFEQIGDERALGNVAALTEDLTVSPSVKLAARDCLPYLQIRAEQAKQSQTLLRPSSSNEIAAETLLRPAQGVSASSNDAQELLRPKL